MAVGPDKMVDLEFLQDRADERSASGAGGTDFFKRGERAKQSHERASDYKAGKSSMISRAKERRKVDSLRGDQAGASFDLKKDEYRKEKGRRKN